jgi:diacylglycerol diphosphate phosphatase / phosphatidate phosphatase
MPGDQPGDSGDSQMGDQSTARKTSVLRRPYVAHSIDWVQIIILGAVIPVVLEKYWSPRVREIKLDDPAVGFPQVADIVSSSVAFALVFAVPAVFFIFTEFSINYRARTLLATANVWALGLFEANGITVLVTAILKLLVGRPRPYFAKVCVAYVAKSKTLCTGDASAVSEARKSFPSGHSALSFAAAIYTSVYLVGALTQKTTYAPIGQASQSRGAPLHGPGPKTWKLVVIVLPPMLAALVAVSRTIDYHHNYGDVVAGAIIGSGVAAVVAWNRGDDIIAARKNALSPVLPEVVA